MNLSQNENYRLIGRYQVRKRCRSAHEETVFAENGDVEILERELCTVKWNRMGMQKEMEEKYEELLYLGNIQCEQ